MWKFLVKQQKIEVLEREVIADHQIQYVQFKFTFDGDWKRFHKVVQFSQCDDVYSIVLGTEGTSCYLPAELHVGAVKMSVFGYDTESDTTVRATTVPVTLNIRASGFEGEEPPIPPTPDLYTQLLKRIEDAEHGLDGKSAYEIAVERGFVGTEEEWLASLNGKDGVTPDMSEYPKTTEVTTMIEMQIAPVAEESHTHDNKDTLDAVTPELFADLSGLQQFEDRTQFEIQTLNETVDNLRPSTHSHSNKAVLDATTAPYTIEEQQKLAGITPETYATTETVNEQILLVREAIAPLEHASHNHANKAVLDALTPELFADLQGLQQFEDTTKYDIQTLREGIEPVISQAHWHHNLTLLNSITQAKVAEWDSISSLKTQYNALSDGLTMCSENNARNSARIGVNETNIADIQEMLTDLQNQIDALKNNGYTVLFEYGSDAIRVYGYYIGLVLNGGFFTMEHFAEQYTHFNCPDNHYAMYYGQEDFNWDAQILTCVEKRLTLDENSKIQFRYISGATEDGELYLITPPGGKIDVPITLYARSEIDNGRAIRLDFQWLQTEKFITTETDCTGITAGEYYLAWIGRSNNTHPTIQTVKVKESG